MLPPGSALISKAYCITSTNLKHSLKTTKEDMIFVRNVNVEFAVRLLFSLTIATTNGQFILLTAGHQQNSRVVTE